MKQTQTTVGVNDAKMRFGELLRRVIAGEEITITRYRRPVARLVPAPKTSAKQIRENAIRQMRELASRNQLGDLRVRDLINEGRR